MVTTAVLSLGIVMIYESFFISLDSFEYSQNYLKVVSWLDEQVWQAKDELSRSGELINTQPGGEFVTSNKTFSWDLGYTPTGTPDLFRINAVLSWQEGKRKVRISRSDYALYQKRD